MPKKENNEFASLFDDDALDDKSEEVEKLVKFNIPQHDIAEKEPKFYTPPKPVQPAVPKKKRTSEDFEPNMDALLITAQSPLIAEGLRYLTVKDFSGNTRETYAEAVKGVEVFIKILERNPNNYYKLAAVINTDDDCKEIETVAFKLFKIKHHNAPQTDTQILQAYEMLRNRLKIGYNKALVSTSMISIKKYYLISGNMDEKKIGELMQSNNSELKDDIARYSLNLKIALQLVNVNDYEITKGLKGKDVNTFIIRSSQLLAYYCLRTGDVKLEEYYRRIYENSKKYFITR
jgi:hypothetical protein